MYADNKIGKEGIRNLTEALKTNTTLTELDLSGQDGRRHKSSVRMT